MKILVSACLAGEKCKYNGGDNFSEKLHDFLKDHVVITVCPEVLGGLPIPREPSEMRKSIVVHKDGTSVDEEFHKGAELALEIALKEHVDLAILQSRSPSCGVKEIYDGSFSKRLIPGAGVFAELLQEHGIKAIDIEDFEEKGFGNI